MKGAFMEITRESFKNNFLKNIILRLDFNGVLDTEMEEIIAQVKPFLKSKSFNKYEESINNEVDFEIKKGLNLDKDDVVKEVRSFKTHSFLSEEKGFILDISKNVVCLKINTINYVPFEEYEELFLKIVSIYNDKIDFFTPKRLGLRKINFCFMEDINELNEYFDESFFENSIVLDNSKILNVQKRKSIQLDESHMKMNVFTAIEKGVIKDQELNKIVLDLDAYLDNGDYISNELFEKNSIRLLNDAIFSVYTKAMTEKLRDCLMNDYDGTDIKLKGIETNE